MVVLVCYKLRNQSDACLSKAADLSFQAQSKESYVEIVNVHVQVREIAEDGCLINHCSSVSVE